MADRDPELLALIVELAGHLRRRLTGKSWTAFLNDQDEIDLTAFRLLHIGEASRKLSEALKARHAAIPWPSIYAMRNVISHEYLGVDAALIWHCATTELDELLRVCRDELKALEP